MLRKQGLLEAEIIKHLNKDDPHDQQGIVRLKEVLDFREHLMITFEILSISLYEFLKRNNFNGCSEYLIQRFAIQLIIALTFMRERNVVHCDLKPENILLCHPNKSGVKIIDFGSGTYEADQYYTYI